MRTFSIFIIISLTNAAAGALLVVAFCQSSMSVTWALLGLAIAMAISVFGWGYLRYRKSFRLLRDQSESCDGIDQTTGITELDEIGKLFNDLVSESRRNSSAEASELAELKKMVAKLDRRNHALGRDGLPIDCATQLHSILQGCGSELDSSIRQAIACGQEIHQATEEIVIGSEAQSDSVEKTTSFIEQLTSRIITVSDDAETALESSTKAKSTANKGLQQFQELVEEMKQIRNHAAARERKLQTLGQHTKEIESIVQTIGTLSSRTDLLALNASIESVRAGENGRGFAIVAEEVRALAEQSAQAVMDITRRIEMIQLETHQSIAVASGEHDQMHGAIKRVTDTLDSLQHIFDAASSSSLGLTEISNSTNQQLQLTREIIVALERSTETSRKNRSRAEGANWTAKTLGQVSQQLENSLDMFRLSGAIETAEPDSNQPAINNSSPSHHDLAPALSQ